MNYFDERAMDWDSDPVKVDRARTVAAAIRREVPIHPGMTALEYGCGTGLLSFSLQPYFGRITLADSSTGMLDVLCGKLAAAGMRNMLPVRLDLSADPLPAERYDVIYSLMTLHHIPDTLQILKAFRALLNPTGMLLVADLDKEDGSFHAPGSQVHHGFDRRELAGKLAEAGFGTTRFRTVYRMTRVVEGERKSFPLFLVAAGKG